MLTSSRHSAAGAADAELAFAGLARQAELVRGGVVSSRELVECCLDRISRYDPALNAFRVVRGERALAEAAAADAVRRASAASGGGGAGVGLPPLLGVAVAVKDDTDVAGETTADGAFPQHPPAAADAITVQRLRAAGAIVVGKTHVPELEITPFTESPTYGATRNPYDLQRTPGGSSGGSAAAVAAGLAPAALGSDGGGSIRIPAACCGLVGLKPQLGRVPTGRAPWYGLSVPGPLTRTVEDAALLLDAIADGDARLRQAATRGAAGDPMPWGRPSLRIAVSLRTPPLIRARADREQRAAVESVARALAELGHEVDERDPDYHLAAAFGFLARYFRGMHDEAPHRLPDTARLARRTRGFLRLGAAFPAATARRAQARAERDAERLWAPLVGADVLLTPVLAHRPLPIGALDGRSALATFDRFSRWVPYPAAFNHTGDPAIAVPAGAAPDGFPLAVQLVARRGAGAEATLVALAAQLESARPWAHRRPPIEASGAGVPHTHAASAPA
jgi:amidase